MFFIWLSKLKEEHFEKHTIYELVTILKNEIAYFPWISNKIAEIYFQMLIEQIDKGNDLPEYCDKMMHDLSMLNEEMYNQLLSYKGIKERNWL